MKGVYFLIGVLLFAACAYIFLAEHGKFYEFFDGTADPSGTPSTGNTTTTGGTDASGNPVPPSANTSPAPSYGPGLANTAPSTTSSPTSPAPSYGPGLANTVPPSANTGTAGPTSPAPSYGPGLANTVPPSANTGTPGPTSPAPSYGPNLAMSGSGTAPQGNLAPGSTTANPTTSTPSQQDFNVLQYAVNSFSSAVDAYSGGKAGVLGKLSPEMRLTLIHYTHRLRLLVPMRIRAHPLTQLRKLLVKSLSFKKQRSISQHN